MKIKRPHLSKAGVVPVPMAAVVDRAEDAADISLDELPGERLQYFSPQNEVRNICVRRKYAYLYQ
jgi:hypothetical protein